MIDVGTAVGYLMLDTSGFKSGFGSAMQDLQTFKSESATVGDKFSAMGSAMSSVGGTLTKSVTLPLVGIGTALGAMSISFEDAMAKVSTIADTTEVPLGDLQKGILELSDKTGIAATDIADNVYNAISAGQKTADAVSFVENATKLATAGFTSSASSLDVLTTIMNAYGLEAGEVNKVSDMLITTQNLGKTTVNELSSSMGKVIPIANANNVALDQLSAAYAVLTAGGIATAESTTYLKGMINELGKSGTTVSNTLKDKTGKSFQQLMEDGSSLGDVLGILQDHATDTGQNFGDLWGSVEAGTAAMAIMSGGVDKFNNTVDAMNESTGATDDAFEKMKTTSFDLGVAWNEIKNVAIDLGDTLMQTLGPMIEGIIGKVREFTTWFKSLDEGAKQNIITIGMVAAAIGPLLLVFGKISSAIGSVISLIGGAGGLSGILTALTGPIGIIIAAVAALALAWSTNFGGIRDATSEIFNSIQTIISTVWDTIMTLWNDNFLGIQDIVKTWWESFELYWNMIFDTIAGIFEIFSLAFQGDWEGVWEKVKEIFSNIWETVKTLFSNFLNTIVDTLIRIGVRLLKAAKDAFDNVMKGFKEIWKNITDWFSKAIEDPVGTIKGIGQALFDAGASIFTFLWDGLKSIWDQITGWVTDGINWLVSKIKFWEDESEKINTEGSDGKIKGSFATGLDYVPQDMNVRVHEGEAILTKAENASRSGGSGGDTYNFYSPEALTPVRAAQEMKKAKKELAMGFE